MVWFLRNQNPKKKMSSKQLEKRGRKKGSKDLVFVTIKTLLEYIPETSSIPVRRKWIESLEEFHGVKFVTPAPKEVGVFNEVKIKENLANERDAAIRPRIFLEEDENL